MKTSYNPYEGPDAKSWLQLDEMTRLLLVTDYHMQAGDDLPNVHLHATIHVIVENQSALGDDYPVRATLNRLVNEGLDRHEAIHAVGSILMKYLHEAATANTKSPGFSDRYFEEVKQLTARQWLDEFG